MFKRNTGFTLAALTAMLLIFQAAPRLFAQDQGDYDQDPPGRAGRIGFVQGSVSFQPGGEGDWLDAVPNRPLTSGDNLWADRDARAEVQVGSTSIRVAPETSLTLLDLEDNVTQLRVSVGSVFFRIRHLDPDDTFEVDTPNLAFNVDQPGEYRVDVNENGDQTTARVWRGNAEITGGGNSYRLGEGQQGTFSGTDQLSYDVGGIGGQDDFERWALDRDRREDSFRSSQYVSTEMTGYEDLDDYGRWRNVEGYGNVWTPNGVDADWAPYRNGHWTYVGAWGWSWVEDEPWGFAPFHYGRWAYAGDSWCWIPGPVAVRPVYSPALVAFVGGGGFNVGVGVGGGVGWFPLGPGEVFVPWYRTSPRYVENVNVTNTRVTVVQVTNVYNNRVNNVTYVNQRGGRGITVVNHDTFVNARPVNRNIERVDVRQYSSAPVTHDFARNIQPSRQSVVGTAHTVRQAPPQQVMTRQVVATRQPRVMNRPAVQGMTRAAAPPPVRTVRPAPANQAESLNKGARGQSRGGGNAAVPAGGANRPGAPDNRPGGDNRPGADNRPGGPGNNQPGANNRPGQPNDNRPGQPDNNRPGGPNSQPGANNRPGQPNDNRPGQPDNNRPGASDNNRPENNAPRPGTAPRPGAGNNQPDRGEAAPRPGAGDSRPDAPDNNNAGRPGGRDNNPGRDNSPAGRGVPRPPSSRPDQGQPERGPNAPSGNARPDNTPESRAPRPSAPDNRPTPAENRPSPDNRPAPADNRHEAAPPERRQAPAARPDNAPQRESRPAPPQSESRPEARPSGTAEERPSRSEQSRPEKNNNKDGNKDNEKDKDRPKN